MWEYRHTDELYHYGVKGMKWGKRKKVQLTTAYRTGDGKVHYMVNDPMLKQDRIGNRGYNVDPLNRMKSSPYNKKYTRYEDYHRGAYKAMSKEANRVQKRKRNVKSTVSNHLSRKVSSKARLAGKARVLKALQKKSR